MPARAGVTGDALPFLSPKLRDLCVHVSAAGSRLLTWPGLKHSFLSYGRISAGVDGWFLSLCSAEGPTGADGRNW